MSLLFETIRISEGVPQYLSWHERRMKRSAGELWGKTRAISLSALIKVPEEYSRGMVRCNIFYGPQIQKIVFEHYRKRSVRSLKLIQCDPIDYHLKFADRDVLDRLFSVKSECDDILIVREGLVTDTSFSNIIFLKGDRWFTPAQPLLRGTCRDRLVELGFLEEREVRTANLDGFDGFKLINAMRYPEEEELFPISAIHGRGNIH